MSTPRLARTAVAATAAWMASGASPCSTEYGPPRMPIAAAMGERPTADSERGAAILWALIFVTITAGLVVSQNAYTSARRNSRDARYNRASMAETFARSGLQDAVGWFHGRANQPITDFSPAYDPHGIPPRIETIAPDIGLVREFPINGNLWGRYEVRKTDARDVSRERGNLVPGSAWELGVRAFIFRRRSAEAAFDQLPNQLVGTKSLSSELRWLNISTPAPAALCVDEPGRTTLGSKAILDGAGSIAIAYRDPATLLPVPSILTPLIDAAAIVTGALQQLGSPTYDATPARVFAMSIDELRTYSDVTLETEVGGGGWDWARLLAWLRSILTHSAPAEDAVATDSTPRIDGRLVVTKSLRLDGKLQIVNSLLVIDGNLTSSMAADVQIDGIVYVNGDATLAAGKIDINGLLVVRGTAKIGTGFLSTGITLRYDAARIEQVRRTVGRYREQRSRNPVQ
jgi:hypothetical protein